MGQCIKCTLTYTNIPTIIIVIQSKHYENLDF